MKITEIFEELRLIYNMGYEAGVEMASSPYCDVLEIEHENCIDARNKAQLECQKYEIRIKNLQKRIDYLESVIDESGTCDCGTAKRV